MAARRRATDSARLDQELLQPVGGQGLGAGAGRFAARAPDAPPGLATMKLYDGRHTAISMALHSTLVMRPAGMNLHPQAAMAGHSIQTSRAATATSSSATSASRRSTLEGECAEARRRVEETPSPLL